MLWFFFFRCRWQKNADRKSGSDAARPWRRTAFGGRHCQSNNISGHIYSAKSCIISRVQAFLIACCPKCDSPSPISLYLQYFGFIDRCKTMFDYPGRKKKSKQDQNQPIQAWQMCSLMKPDVSFSFVLFYFIRFSACLSEKYTFIGVCLLFAAKGFNHLLHWFSSGLNNAVCGITFAASQR